MRSVIVTLIAAYFLAACSTGRTLDGDAFDDASVTPSDDLGSDETFDWGDDPPPPGEGEDDPFPEEDAGPKEPDPEYWAEDAGEPPDPEPPPEDTDAGAFPVTTLRAHPSPSTRRRRSPRTVTPPRAR
ncbi:MAG: hypothetical protein R3A52_05935 [Polyangiales bacterium]